MATREQQSYIPVPPPPLPEFYTTKPVKRKEKTESSSASTVEVDEETIVIKETFTGGDGAYDRQPGLPVGSAPSRPYVTFPPNGSGDGIPPLAIYHICRICLRPRSPRYHREHPIPVDGVPPPPGICRRCRVTSVEDTKKVAEVVTISESNPIKIGCITPFVSDEDIISNEEMRRMKVEQYLEAGVAERERSRHSRGGKSGKDIRYRHVRVVDGPSESESENEEEVEEVIEEVVLPRKKRVVFTSRASVDSFEDVAVSKKPTRSKTVGTSLQVQPTENPPSVSSKGVKSEALRKIDSTKALVSTQVSSSTSKSSSTSTAKASAKVSAPAQPEYAESDIRKIARDEIEQHAKEALEPRQRHAEIRRIAREEVEHYRQAERRLEAHPEAFAHGRLVPIERRIDIERDTAEPTPWSKSAHEEASPSKVSPKTVSQTSRNDFEYEPAKEPTRERKDSIAGSWGPKWRRELSIERHTRRETSHTNASRDKDVVDDKRSRPDTVIGSNAPRLSSRTEPYVVEVTRHQPADKRDVIEVVEEVDPPPRSRVASYRRQGPETRPPPPQEPPMPERGRELRTTYRREESVKPSSPPVKPVPAIQEDVRSQSTTHQYYMYDDSTVRTSNTRSMRPDTSSKTGGPNADAQPPPPLPAENLGRASTHSRVTFQSNTESDKTRWPKEQSIRGDGNDSRAPSNKSLPYPEHNMMPDRPVRPSESERKAARIKTFRQDNSTEHPKSEYIYVERTVQPADRPKGSRPFEDRPAEEHVETEETWVVRRRPEGEGRSQRRRRERRERDQRPMRESDESHHVKFNSKVEISPTPPGSDASSSEFRSFHSIGGSHRQIDRNDDRQPGGKFVAEVERRGRTRSRGSKPKYFHERETVYEMDNGEQVVVPKDGKMKNSHRGAAWATGGRPLMRALSESPAREEGIPPSNYSKSDGRGPYREEQKVTDSMRVEDGSPGGRAWRDLVGSTHGSIGEAARVRW